MVFKGIPRKPRGNECPTPFFYTADLGGRKNKWKNLSFKDATRKPRKNACPRAFSIRRIWAVVKMHGKNCFSKTPPENQVKNACPGAVLQRPLGGPFWGASGLLWAPLGSFWAPKRSPKDLPGRSPTREVSGKRCLSCRCLYI